MHHNTESEVFVIVKEHKPRCPTTEVASEMIWRETCSDCKAKRGKEESKKKPEQIRGSG